MQETWTVASSSMFGAAATGVSQFHVADPAAPSEMIAVTNVSGTTWTVTRGAESTIPVQHAAGFTVYQVTTAGFLGAAVPVTVTVPLPTGATATDTPAVTAAISSLVTALASGPATLLFQDGTYQIDSDSAVIQSVSNFAVRSAGATVIQLAPNRSGQYNTNGDLFVIADCTDFTGRGYRARLATRHRGPDDTADRLSLLGTAVGNGRGRERCALPCRPVAPARTAD